MITERQILFIQYDQDNEKKYKAKYVAGGNLDIMKD